MKHLILRMRVLSVSAVAKKHVAIKARAYASRADNVPLIARVTCCCHGRVKSGGQCLKPSLHGVRLLG